MPVGSEEGKGIAISVIVPLVLISPILLPENSVNHTFPLLSNATWKGNAPVVPSGNILNDRLVMLKRHIALVASSLNQTRCRLLSTDIPQDVRVVFPGPGKLYA